MRAPRRSPSNKLAFQQKRSAYPSHCRRPKNLGSEENLSLLLALRDLELHRTELLSQNDELRETQSRLEASRDRFVQLYNAAPVGYLTLTINGKILEANLPLAQLLRLPVSALVGAPLHRFVTPDCQDTLYFHLQSLRSNLQSASCRLEIAPPRTRGPSPHSPKAVCVQLDSRTFFAGNTLQILIAVVDVSECEVLQREILQTSELERLRVASELHDGICQEIVGIELLLHSALKTLPENCDLTCFDTVLAEIRNAAEHARQLAHVTSPAVNSEGSLGIALRTLAERTRKVHRIHCSFSEMGSVSKPAAAVACQFLRIAQEAVNNAAKHGRASHIAIDLHQAGSQLELTVSDDGTGFTQKMEQPGLSTATGGLGLRIMQHRASLINAQLQIVENPGGGTRVSCSIYCPHPSDRPQAIRTRILHKKKTPGDISRRRL